MDTLMSNKRRTDYTPAAGTSHSQERVDVDNALQIVRFTPTSPHQSSSQADSYTVGHNTSDAVALTQEERAYRTSIDGHYSFANQCGYGAPNPHVARVPSVPSRNYSSYSHTIVDLETPRDIYPSNQTTVPEILKSAPVASIATTQVSTDDVSRSGGSLRYRKNARNTPTEQQECSFSPKAATDTNNGMYGAGVADIKRHKSTPSLGRHCSVACNNTCPNARRKYSYSSMRSNLPPSIKTTNPVFHANVMEASPTNSTLDKMSSKDALLDPEEEARFSWDAEEPSSEGTEDKKKKQGYSSVTAGGATDEVCCSHLVKFFPRWVLWILMNLVIFIFLMVPVFLHRRIRLRGAFILSGSGSTYIIYVVGFHAGYYVVQMVMKGIWRLILLCNTRAIRVKINGYKVHLSSIGCCIWLSIAIVCWVVFMEVPMCSLARDSHIFEAEGAEEKACQSWGLWWVRQVLVGCLASACLYIVKTAIIRGIWAHFGQATYMERLETALYHDSILAKISAFDGIHGNRRRLPSADIRIKSAGGILDVIHDSHQNIVPRWRRIVSRVQEIFIGFQERIQWLVRIFTRPIQLMRSLFPSSKPINSPSESSTVDHRDVKDHPKNKLNITHLLKKHTPGAPDIDEKLKPKSGSLTDGGDKTNKGGIAGDANATDSKDTESMKEPLPWEKAWQVFDTNNRGIVTRSMFKKSKNAVLSIKRECRNLSLSYTDLSNAIGKLEMLVNGIFVFLIIVAFLASFEVAVVHTFTVSISSAVFAPNYVLASKFINNMTRSAEHVDSIIMDVPLFTTARTIQKLKQRILAFTEGEGSNDYIKIDVILNAINNHTKEGHSRACLQIVFRVFHRGKWLDSQFLQRKTSAILFLRETLNDLEQEDLRDLMELRRKLALGSIDLEQPKTVNELGQEVSQEELDGCLERNEHFCSTGSEAAASAFCHCPTCLERHGAARTCGCELEGTTCQSKSGSVGGTGIGSTIRSGHQVTDISGANPSPGHSVDVQGDLVNSQVSSSAEERTQRENQQQQPAGRHNNTVTAPLHPRYLLTQETVQLSTAGANIQPFPNGFLFQR
ncbi:hypothetical protein BGW42_001902 [Actinomortierella wolfii]|nr:hypothetical protein BGW42_001902 [Actinomortierella wolfii]